MNNQTLFVQFLHPGVEHDPKPKNGNFIPWNTGKHKRKFMKNPGQYLENNCPKNSDLVFWGEWEPQSDVLQRFKPSNTYPKYLYQPYYSIPPNQQGLENTDPFIFGKQFHYVCCQQAKKTGFTQLRFLDRGSVILFGSCVNQQFVLDTVFVVDSWHDIDSFAQAKKLISSTYQDVTFDRIFNSSCSQQSQNSCTQSMSNRLYFGATYNKPVEGMFSFFPCLPYQQNMTNGFPRPVIQIKDVITDNCTQGFKYDHPNYPKNIQTNQQLWEEVKKQVENANLKLGIYTDLPPRKPSSPNQHSTISNSPKQRFQSLPNIQSRLKTTK
jgi:hypothetical protein